MALVRDTGRFLKTRARLFHPKNLSPLHLDLPSSSYCTGSTPSFFWAFRRTIVFSPRHPHSSTLLRQLHAFSLHEAIDFNVLKHEIHKDEQPRVSKLFNFLKGVDNFPSGDKAPTLLDESGITPDERLVNSAIWGLRDEWKLAFGVFKWGLKWGCNGEKTWSLIIWVLGDHKKFNTAWRLINDLHRSSLDTQQAMLIMIHRYAAANHPAKAIRTFQIMHKFKTSPDEKSYYALLYVLCKHGNVEEAEEFMYLNKKLFPLETDGFNIILNGWCNISVDIFEAKKVWREMAKCCVIPNSTSYTHMISCFSKVGNLFDSLRLYDQMKKREWVPGREVYNSLVYVLARENCLKEALKTLDKMKEASFSPDSVTYNSIIVPLCEAGKFGDAKNVLANMIVENLNLTIETYHALLAHSDFEETLEMIKHMHKDGLIPNGHTLLLLCSKFLKWDQPENALKIWEVMKEYEINRDSSHYSVMIEGLIRLGLLVKAKELYTEMMSRRLREEPKLKKMLNERERDSDVEKVRRGIKKNVKFAAKGNNAARSMAKKANV